MDAVKYLVEECQADVDVKDDAGRMPLHHACERGSEEIVRYLLEECRCANHLTTCDNAGQTAMHKGLLSDNLDLIHFLVRFDGGISLMALLPVANGISDVSSP